MPIRTLVVFGTRPEAIKMAPVVLALRDDPRFEPFVLVTAQHRELLDQVLALFDIAPDYDLDVMEHGQTLTQITTRVLAGVSELLDRERFDVLLVHGDTTTTLAAALAAFYHRIPVAHVEAGMRTFDLAQPFPEEANRVLVARLARWNFAPSETCEQNLLREGIDPSRVFRTSHNTAIDAARLAGDRAHEFPPGHIADALSSGRRLVLVTAHRRESWGTPMEGIFSAVARIAETHADVHVLVATHPNPAVSVVAERVLGGLERVDLIGAQEYLPFSKLMAAAYLIVSDSGGIQEEGPALGTPVAVLRDVTEYPELIDRGVVTLAGTSEESVFAVVDRVLTDNDEYARMKRACAIAHPGTATATILRVLLDER